MKQPNTVTEEFLHGFKAGDLVDVRIKFGHWSGPHKLVKYEIEPPKKRIKPVAHIEVEFGESKLERLLIVGDQRVIRKHIPQEQNQQKSSPMQMTD